MLRHFTTVAITLSLGGFVCSISTDAQARGQATQQRARAYRNGKQQRLDVAKNKALPRKARKALSEHEGMPLARTDKRGNQWEHINNIGNRRQDPRRAKANRRKSAPRKPLETAEMRALANVLDPSQQGSNPHRRLQQKIAKRATDQPNWPNMYNFLLPDPAKVSAAAVRLPKQMAPKAYKFKPQPRPKNGAGTNASSLLSQLGSTLGTTAPAQVGFSPPKLSYIAAGLNNNEPGGTVALAGNVSNDNQRAFEPNLALTP